MRTGLRTLGLTSSGQNATGNTQNADEATLDGEIQSQYSVNVSSLNLNTE